MYVYMYVCTYVFFWTHCMCFVLFCKVFLWTKVFLVWWLYVWHDIVLNCLLIRGCWRVELCLWRWDLRIIDWRGRGALFDVLKFSSVWICSAFLWIFFFSYWKWVSSKFLAWMEAKIDVWLLFSVRKTSCSASNLSFLWLQLCCFGLKTSFSSIIFVFREL